jgi:hypothetical protein
MHTTIILLFRKVNYIINHKKDLSNIFYKKTIIFIIKDMPYKY